MKELRKKLKDDKIKINWNKNPIEMDLFLSFITISTIINIEHVGYSTGWTQHVNEGLNLIISGGIINGREYLDSIQFGKKLANPYNNYVNPFYLWEILTNDGKKFFIKYYEEDILKIIDGVKNDLLELSSELEAKEIYYNILVEENKLLIATTKESMS